MGFVTRYLIVLTVCAGNVLAQKAPAFDIASVKLTGHGRDANGFSRSSIGIVSPGRLVGTNASMSECIRYAWSLKDYQLTGPPWLNDDAASYDIEAKAPVATSEKQVREMLQTLLAERFRLTVHERERTFQVYYLKVGKNGPKLTAAKPEEKDGFLSQGGSGSVRISTKGSSMTAMADRLTRDLDRPVFDRTGIEGLFAISLQWYRGDGDGPSVFSALQELGLQLDSASEPIRGIVVDHADKVPTAN